MFSFFKKKEEPISKTQQLMNALGAEVLNKELATKLYLACIDEVIRNSKSFDEVENGRNQIYIKIYAARHGIKWFSEACSEYFKDIQGITEIDDEAEVLDAFLGGYWFFIRYDKEAFSGLIACLEKDVSPLVRRYYEKTFNIDIYTGEVFDPELEEKNAFKEHFYRASYAYNQGQGDLELSMKEWRYFLMELAKTLESRPRAIYDFASEVCEHQKLFMFVAYAMKAERFDKMHNAAAHVEGGALDTVLKKITNAVYATNEDYGIFLKRYYA
ncbi:MAG: hypothetical protein IKM20_01145 [Erysipelotrichales bacterium]|nr:hypothetical protein [Erysipelotrichales bacterium]